MTLAIVYSRATVGIEAPLVTVEVHVGRGLPKMNIVGLPATAVKESKDRVRSAILNTQFEFPRHRLTINLAPADLPKEGGRFDLPIALGILAASGQIPVSALTHREFVGELALSGELRAIKGVLPVVMAARQIKRALIVPGGNEFEAGLVSDFQVLLASHLLEVVAFLKGEKILPCPKVPGLNYQSSSLDLSDIRGQWHAKRALEIAATGRHSILLVGPPGTGKTMLANRLPTLLPALNQEEALEVATIASLSHVGFAIDEWQKMPFRSPHHSSSVAALVGGGRPPRPGEVSLSHHGVLFLDELPEFNRQALESLREPLEAGQVTISRAAFQAAFPALFQLVAAMNPCPCGFLGSQQRECRCNSDQIQRYLTKISGPLLDRIDMQVEVSHLPPEVLAQDTSAETSHDIKQRVLDAQALQKKRQGKYNQSLTVPDLKQWGALTPTAMTLLQQMMKKLHFSARAYHRIIKIARTIADLAKSDQVSEKEISEALSYRSLDRLIFKQINFS